MKTKKQRAYSDYAREAALMLGRSIELGRKTRKYSVTDFADRVGVSRNTLAKIEKGDLRCELGFVLEAATLAGVSLFEVDPDKSNFSKRLEGTEDKLALLPKTVRKRRKVIDDDF